MTLRGGARGWKQAQGVDGRDAAAHHASLDPAIASLVERFRQGRAMTVATFDTYTAAKALRKAGFDERQAEAAVVMVRDAVTESVATKADLSRLEDKVETLEDKMATKADLSAWKTRWRPRPIWPN